MFSIRSCPLKLVHDPQSWNASRLSGFLCGRFAVDFASSWGMTSVHGVPLCSSRLSFHYALALSVTHARAWCPREQEARIDSGAGRTADERDGVLLHKSADTLRVGERNHQGLDNQLIAGRPVIETMSRVRRHSRLGGLLNFYQRAA
jgi:hypothetical protein